MVAAPSVRHDPLDRGPLLGAQAGAVAQDVDADALAPQLRHFAGDVLFEQTHQRGDFGGGAVPVFLGEREEGEHLDAALDGAFHHLADRFHAGAVPQGPGHQAPAGPAPVAVHDDGYVTGHAPVQTNLRQEIRGDH